MRPAARSGCPTSRPTRVPGDSIRQRVLRAPFPLCVMVNLDHVGWIRDLKLLIVSRGIDRIPSPLNLKGLLRDR